MFSFKACPELARYDPFPPPTLAVPRLGELSLLLPILRPASVDPVDVSHELRRLHHLRQRAIAVITPHVKIMGGTEAPVATISSTRG